MDAIDRKIIAELQMAGRLTVTELAERVSLSVAPCHRRLRELERTKAIRGYRAVIAEVRHAERLFGDPDYLIRVATADLAAYQELRDSKLAALPGIQRMSS